MSKVQNIAGRICGTVAGVVMLVAGILKLMDPVGATLVVESYLGMYGFTSVPGWMQHLCAAVLAGAEVALGAALALGIFRKAAAVCTLAMLSIYTFLTASLWVDGSQMSCGCFGEALPMDAAQSTLKNIALMGLTAAYLILAPAPGGRRERITFAAAIAVSAALLVYSENSLPLIDFTPMRAGSDVSEEFDGIPLDGRVAIISFYDEDPQMPSGFNSSMAKSGLRPVAVSAFPLDGAFTADRRAIMTLNRRDGGVTLLEDGVVVKKFAIFAGSTPYYAGIQ